MAETEIRINLDALAIGDLETLDKAGRNELPIAVLVDLLDRIVEGGVRHLPLTALPQIVQALNAEVEKLANPAGN